MKQKEEESGHFCQFQQWYAALPKGDKGGVYTSQVVVLVSHGFF